MLSEEAKLGHQDVHFVTRRLLLRPFSGQDHIFSPVNQRNKSSSAWTNSHSPRKSLSRSPISFNGSTGTKIRFAREAIFTSSTRFQLNGQFVLGETHAAAACSKLDED